MSAVLARWFPLYTDKNIFLYYVYNALYGLYPVNAIVGLYFLFKGLTFAEIGIVFTVFSLAGFIFEVPTGYIADRYGRRTSIIIGLLILTLTSLAWVFAVNYIQFAVIAGVWMVGVTCISGSFEAYIYDHLVDIGATEYYDDVLSKTSMLWYYTGAAGAVIGAYLFSVHATFPYLMLSAIFAALTAVVLCMDHDTPRVGATEASLTPLTGFAHILSNPSLICVTLFVACFWGYHEFFISSVNSPYIMSLNVFSVAYLGLFMATSSLVKGYISAHFARLRQRLSNTGLVVVLTIVQVATLLGMGLTTGLWGLASIFVFMQLYAFEAILRNSFAQKHIPSVSRATTLSTMNVIGAVVASTTGFGVGALIDVVGLHASFVWVALGMAVVLTALLVLRSVYKIQL